MMWRSAGPASTGKRPLGRVDAASASASLTPREKTPCRHAARSCDGLRPRRRRDPSRPRPAAPGDADPLRPRQWRPCRPLDDDALALRGQWLAGRSPARAQFHRSAVAQRRCGGPGRPLRHGRPAARAHREVDALLARTGASRLALVASSRGGNAVRNFVVEAGGAPKVSHAVLCGTPNRGVFAWDANPGSEFNGRGPS